MANYANVGGSSRNGGTPCRMVMAFSRYNLKETDSVNQLYFINERFVGAINHMQTFRDNRFDARATLADRRREKERLPAYENVEYVLDDNGTVHMIYRAGDGILIEVIPENRQRLEAALAGCKLKPASRKSR